MGRDRLRTYAGVIPICKQLGNRIVGDHPIVPMDFGVFAFFLKCMNQIVRKQLGHKTTNQRDVFQNLLNGKRVLNS